MLLQMYILPSVINYLKQDKSDNIKSNITEQHVERLVFMLITN